MTTIILSVERMSMKTLTPVVVSPILVNESKVHPVGHLLVGVAVPHDLVEAAEAAVEAVGAVVLGQLDGLAVEGEGGVGDAVADAADGGAEVGVLAVLAQVAVEVVEAEGHVLDLPVAVRDAEGADGRSVADQLNERIELKSLDSVRTRIC